jgi:hypothetical protein
MIAALATGEFNDYRLVPVIRYHGLSGGAALTESDSTRPQSQRSRGLHRPVSA